MLLKILTARTQPFSVNEVTHCSRSVHIVSSHIVSTSHRVDTSDTDAGKQSPAEGPIATPHDNDRHFNNSSPQTCPKGNSSWQNTTRPATSETPHTFRKSSATGARHPILRIPITRRLERRNASRQEDSAVQEHRSDRGITAVNHDRRSGHIASRITREINGQRPKILWLPEVARRDLRLER
jgi:hypothetical protein